VAIFKRLVEEDVLDIVMPDVKFCGGPVEAYRTGMELEPSHPGSVSMHCPSGPVSLLASAHATAAFGNVLPLEHAVYEVGWRREVLEPFEVVKGGMLHLPEGPGLGARVDPVLVEMRGRRWEE
jgi:galactonate dehydratase